MVLPLHPTLFGVSLRMGKTSKNSRKGMRVIELLVACNVRILHIISLSSLQ